MAGANALGLLPGRVRLGTQHGGHHHDGAHHRAGVGAATGARADPLGVATELSGVLTDQLGPSRAAH